MCTQTLILIVGAVASILILANATWSLHVARSDIFRGSGVPVSMAQVLLSSMYLVAQQLVAVLLIVTIEILIVSGDIENNAGLPIISAVVGYALGKSFKDMATISPGKNGNTEKQDTPNNP